MPDNIKVIWDETSGHLQIMVRIEDNDVGESWWECVGTCKTEDVAIDIVNTVITFCRQESANADSWNDVTPDIFFVTKE